MTDVLVLNASYEPLRLVSVRRAIILLLQQKAELVESATQRLRAQSASFAVPLVVRLVRYITIPRHRQPPCSRRGVLARDRETCQYCGTQPGRAHLTIDHVLPRAHGGTTNWENVVAACAACNHRKANRTPQQAGMALACMPRRPSYTVNGHKLRICHAEPQRSIAHSRAPGDPSLRLRVTDALWPLTVYLAFTLLGTLERHAAWQKYAYQFKVES